MNLNDPISNYELSNTELALLRKGKYLFTLSYFLPHNYLFKANLHTVTDLLLASIQDAAKKCKTSPIQVKQIFDKVLNSVPLLKFDTLDALPDDEIFTTGDTILDNALGGGIRTHMVWEIAGER
jgi:DNA repair protein RAD57